MNLRNPRLWLTLASLTVVLLLVTRDLRERTSPGPLSQAHGELQSLAGNSGCSECHGEDDGEMNMACRRCHATIDLQVASFSGLHGHLELESAASCGGCHLEHLGSEVSLVGLLAFARAGFEDPEQFDHSHVPFHLKGRHDALDCEACHPNANVGIRPADQGRFHSASQSCASCHEDVHTGKYGTDCAGCHGQESLFEDLSNFVHTSTFPLRGSHRVLECSSCHREDSPTSLASLVGKPAGGASRDCVACHDSPHAPAFLKQVAADEGTTTRESCAACHDAEHRSFAEGATLSIRQHASSGFALTGPHEGLACEACHRVDDSPAAVFADRYPGRSQNRCESCHADHHEGQFSSGAFAGAGCVTCHANHEFSPHRFTAELHESSRFPLEAAHRQVACADCHRERTQPAGPTHFAGAPTRCDACHGDAHAGGLIGNSKDGCAECHRPSSFADLERELFDHKSRTRFPLLGAHSELACEGCHLPRPQPDALGRRFGRVEVDRSRLSSEAGCDQCHTDVHAAAFESQDLPTLVQGRGDCARCHTNRSFQDLQFGRFDHEFWTGFVLHGAHDAVACQSCHGQAAASSKRSFGRVSDHLGKEVRNCQSCHEDPHLGAFDQAGMPRRMERRESCARCHDSGSFLHGTREGFNHDLWTPFKLEGAHRAVDCNSCHTRKRDDRLLGSAPGSSCADCHRDPHAGQFASEGSTDCQRCHDVSPDFRILEFDHQTQSRFSLDERHAALSCNSCHRPWPLADGSRITRYKPLGTACGDCHATDPGDG